MATINYEQLFIEDEAQRLREVRAMQPTVNRVVEAKLLDDLTYASYKAQRELYKVPFERCRDYFEDYRRYEIRYQLELMQAKATT